VPNRSRLSFAISSRICVIRASTLDASARALAASARACASSASRASSSCFSVPTSSGRESVSFITDDGITRPCPCDPPIAHGKARGTLTVIAPLAFEAVKRIDAIFDIEREINGRSIDQRVAVRRERVAPLVSELEAWMRQEYGKLSRHSDVAK